jgi:hypothetical protein
VLDEGVVPQDEAIRLMIERAKVSQGIGLQSFGAMIQDAIAGDMPQLDMGVPSEQPSYVIFRHVPRRKDLHADRIKAAKFAQDVINIATPEEAELIISGIYVQMIDTVHGRIKDGREFN